MENQKLVFRVNEKLDVFILNGDRLKIRLKMVESNEHIDLPLKFWRVIVRNYLSILNYYKLNVLPDVPRNPFEVEFVKKNFKNNFDVRAMNNCIWLSDLTQKKELEIDDFTFRWLCETSKFVEKEIRKLYGEKRKQKKKMAVLNVEHGNNGDTTIKSYFSNFKPLEKKKLKSINRASKIKPSVKARKLNFDLDEEASSPTLFSNLKPINEMEDDDKILANPPQE